jgi:hypothetical protein
MWKDWIGFWTKIIALATLNSNKNKRMYAGDVLNAQMMLT